MLEPTCLHGGDSREGTRPAVQFPVTVGGQQMMITYYLFPECSTWYACKNCPKQIVPLPVNFMFYMYFLPLENSALMDMFDRNRTVDN
eukprot:scaffold3073_cov66-Cylindrotheca_fusiformis.AAC.3